MSVLLQPSFCAACACGCMLHPVPPKASVIEATLQEKPTEACRPTLCPLPIASGSYTFSESWSRVRPGIAAQNGARWLSLQAASFAQSRRGRAVGLCRHLEDGGWKLEDDGTKTKISECLLVLGRQEHANAGVKVDLGYF